VCEQGKGARVLLLYPEIKVIQISPDQIVALIMSINTAMVAAEGKPLQPTTAVIVGSRNPSGGFSLFIYLYLAQSEECLVYATDPLDFTLEQYREFEMEALQFVETMGFMMENLHFRKMTPERQATTLRDLPIFYPDLHAFAHRAAGGGEGGEAVPLAGAAGALESGDLPSLEPEPEPVLSTEELGKLIRMLSSF